MKRSAHAGGLLAVPLALILFAFGAPARAQHPGWVVVPDTSVERPFDVGRFAHTNHLIFVPMRGGPGPGAGTGPAGLHPDSIRAAYGLSGTGGGVIAIVDAYDYPTALNDFNTFSSQFGLPTEPSPNATSSSNTVLQVVYASGSKPASNAGWALEEALDVEWAHAVAPSAKIVLVEAASNSFANLFKAVQTATSIVHAASGGQVSMSWGGSEFGGETSYDGYFTDSTVAYFAASGDTGGQVIYPSASPNVISAGGTSLTLSGGVWTESGWSGSGGGPSSLESRPPFQDVISGIVGSSRGTPDLSFVADPNTGVSVYDSTRYMGYKGWWVVGGTSLSSPALAGVANLAGGRGSATVLSGIYGHLGTSSFYDVVSGSAGSFSCLAGWDFVTGVGSPRGTGGL